jgi:hypothetical protein
MSTSGGQYQQTPEYMYSEVSQFSLYKLILVCLCWKL